MTPKKDTTASTRRGLVEMSTGVYRIPTTVKEAIEALAYDQGESPALIVRRALARELELNGTKIIPTTARACGLEP